MYCTCFFLITAQGGQPPFLSRVKRSLTEQVCQGAGLAQALMWADRQQEVVSTSSAVSSISLPHVTTFLSGRTTTHKTWLSYFSRYVNPYEAGQERVGPCREMVSMPLGQWVNWEQLTGELVPCAVYFYISLTHTKLSERKLRKCLEIWP